jgi:hypothetical protein
MLKMKLTLRLVFLLSLTLSACSAARLSHDDARQKIAAIGRSSLIPDAIEIRRIVLQSDTQAIAESTVTLAFQFRRNNPQEEWRVDAVRLGDRDWVSLDELLAAINEGRRRTTADSLQKLAGGIAKYQASRGSLPDAKDIVALTDLLHPLYMSDLIREDGWGQPIYYEVIAGSTFRLISPGADELRGTPDDVVVEPGRSTAP